MSDPCKPDPWSHREPDHDWEPWKQLEESGFVVYSKGPKTGHLEPFFIEYQVRICKRCGFLEHSAIRDTLAMLGIHGRREP